MFATRRLRNRKQIKLLPRRVNRCLFRVSVALPLSNSLPALAPRDPAGSSEGTNFSSVNHAPAALVPTWKATRSPNKLIGNSRSLGAGDESGSGASAVGYA